MTTIESQFYSPADWTPLPWWVFPVVPLYGSDGSVLLFCEESIYREEGRTRRRAGIPTEFFNHQMRDIDPADAEAFAIFMSEYGLLGTNVRGGASSTVVMEVATESDARDADWRLQLWRESGTSLSGLSWYREVQEAVRAAALGWGASESFNPDSIDRRFVTVQDAIETHRRLSEAADVVTALLVDDKVGDVACHLGMGDKEVLDHIVACVDYVNQLLCSLSPQMDVAVLEGSKWFCDSPWFESPEGKPYPLPLHEDHERPFREGSLAQAIALQIYEFAKKKADCKRCEQCGKVFAERQTKGRKQASRSSAVYCCDRCKNLANQHRHRKRERARADSEREAILARVHD